jgi:type I phosphodiesterase/nucleotide pyrophosphatase
MCTSSPVVRGHSHFRVKTDEEDARPCLSIPDRPCGPDLHRRLAPEHLSGRTLAGTVTARALSGAIALNARSVFPALTYPAHATIVTGAVPVHHGIIDNEPFEPLGGSGRWIWQASAFRLPTLWDAVRAAGGTTAAISWPTTVGASIDWNVPDVWSPDDPASIAPIRAATTPIGLFDELEREATGRLSDATLLDKENHRAVSRAAQAVFGESIPQSDQSAHCLRRLTHCDLLKALRFEPCFE